MTAEPRRAVDVALCYEAVGAGKTALRAVLEGQAAIADAESEIGAIAFDSDRRFVVVDEGEDVDVCVLAGVEGAAEKVP